MSSKNSARKYCGPKLINSVRKLTQACYETALINALSHYQIDPGTSLMEIENALRMYKIYGLMEDWWLQKAWLTHTQFLELKQKTDNIYIEKLTSLSTKEIEDVLWVHEKRRIVRAPRTVEALLAELARRCLLQDTR